MHPGIATSLASQHTLPGSAAEWLRSPGSGSVHQLAIDSTKTPVTSVKDQLEAKEPLKKRTASAGEHVPRLGLLTTWSFRSAESCHGCGQHLAFCACPADTRLCEELDPKLTKKLAAVALASRPLSLRSLLADVEADELVQFKLAAQAQGKALELAKQNETPTPSPRRRSVTIDTNATYMYYEHPHKNVSPEQVADALLTIRRRRSTVAVIQHTAAAAEAEDRSWRSAEPELAGTASAEIIERYFDSVKQTEKEADEDEEIAAMIETIHQPLLTHKAMDSTAPHMLPSSLPVHVQHHKLVKSESLVFEDHNPDDAMLSSSAPEV